MRLPSLVPIAALAACAGSPNTVEVQLAPAVISSLDGTTVVSAIVAADTTPLEDLAVHMTIDYTDRNGTPHAIAPVDGRTDQRGVFTSTIAGLDWDGTGLVTVTHDAASTGTASFSVLDRTPPKIEILPPTTDRHVGPGLPLDIQVHVSDEIGVSSVILDASGDINIRRRTTLLANGSLDTTLTFRVFVDPGAAAGPTIKLYALASDLSGNLAAATPMELIVDPSISIATPPPLMGSQLVDGSASQLNDPRSIVASTKDGKLYVADRAGTGLCQPSCIWRVDATTGAIDATPVYIGVGTIEGLAVDATSDHLYLTDRQDRIVQLTWSGTAYATPAFCTDTAAQQPTDPYHLVIDATLGILVNDDADRNVQKVALPCSATNTGQVLSAQNSFDSPRGIALSPAGDIYVSDDNADQISKVNRTTGAVTAFDGTLNAPYGVEWLAGGTTQFADSLMVAAGGDRIVASTKGNGSLAAAYLQLRPIDLTFINGTMYVVTEQDGTLNHGRIYKVSGF